MWTSYSLEPWETELSELEQEFDDDYEEEQKYELDLERYEYWLFSQKMDFYEDIAAAFVKFEYELPTPYQEDSWCMPNFRCLDEMGLFFMYLDTQTFITLQRDILKLNTTAYQAEGKQHYCLAKLRTLFDFADRWCSIHVLYLTDEYKNYKMQLWVAHCILNFLDI